MFKVALVGKPNVGKSSLFNRLINHKKAIICEQEGTTRDRNYSICQWVGRQFKIIDTGGVLNNLNLPFQDVVNQQVNFAIEEANIILFMVSYKEGINKNDHYIAKLLKKNCKNKKIILVVNKSENVDQTKLKQFYSLKFGNFFLVSASHGLGTGDLLDAIVACIPNKQDKKEETSFKFCIVGKPNVGKSSLVNAILNENRVIVSPQANTTRDSIDCKFKYQKKSYTIIDTAGIRRKGKISEDIDKYAYLRTKEAISRSNLIIMMLDATNEVSEQDKIIGGLAYNANIPTIIVINKWDAIKKNNQTYNQFKKILNSHFEYLSWAPIIFISAKNKQKINIIFETIEMIKQQLAVKVTTASLNDVLAKAQITNPPPKFKNGRINIHYGTQIESQIPTFVLFTNDPKYLHFSYARYIENQIRSNFKLQYVPITVYYKDKNSRIRK